MVARLHAAWEALSGSYWFVPSVAGVGALLLSVATISLDARIDDARLVAIDLIPVVRSEGARSVLTTIASSMITVGSIVFSLTLLVLTQASSQFGPRLLVNFMHDRTNQVVLASFVATFVYALLVLRVVTTGDDELGVSAFVPQISVFVSLLLTFATLGALVFFFHHVAQSVRVTHVLADVGRALEHRLEAMPQEDGNDPDLSEELSRFAADGGVAFGPVSGYLQEVRAETLVRIADERDAVVRLIPPVGSFLIRGAPLAEVHPERATLAVGDELAQALVVGEDRSMTQDPGFLFDELLEIALRALSPSMQDPFTARSCIDRIAQGLLLLDRRRLPKAVHREEGGIVRAILNVPDKGVLARRLLAEIRRAGRHDLMVVQHLVATLTMLRAQVVDRELASAVEKELAAVVEEAERELSERDARHLRAVSGRTDELSPPP
jgi:uncharacterized membrane protein